MAEQTQEEKIIELKAKYLEYFRKLPIQKLAAEFIHRSPDTIQIWQREDDEFSAQVDLAKAEWALNNVSKVRSKEWLLERLMKDHFAPRQEITGKEGDAIQFGALSDEQLDKLIESKLRKVGTSLLTSGEGETNGGESA